MQEHKTGLLCFASMLFGMWLFAATEPGGFIFGILSISLLGWVWIVSADTDTKCFPITMDPDQRAVTVGRGCCPPPSSR